MGTFRRFLQDLELTELHLNGRLYTWSNECEHPTLERIDHAFACLQWCDRFPHHMLSDHAPLILHSNIMAPAKNRFKFEAIWPKFPGYLEAVAEGWRASLHNADPFRNLDYKLRNTAKALKSWSQKHVGSIRLQLAVARELIFKLEQAQDYRALSTEEVQLRSELKFKCLGLASLARIIACQRSRITFLREGDANTNYFHLQACHRGRVNHIAQLADHDTVIVDEIQKAQVVFEHYDSILGNYEDRIHSLDLDLLGIPADTLTGLDHCFSVDEVWSAIRSLPPDKAPGPDGFTGLFYQTAWPVIREDLMHAFNAFWSMDFRSLHLVNQAYIILLRKS
jgi:hypothetical protein